MNERVIIDTMPVQTLEEYKPFDGIKGINNIIIHALPEAGSHLFLVVHQINSI